MKLKPSVLPVISFLLLGVIILFAAFFYKQYHPTGALFYLPILLISLSCFLLFTILRTNRTEKKQHLEQIAKERILSDTVINSLPGMFYLFSAEGKFLRWNKNLELTGNYSTEEVSKMHPSNFFPEDEREFVIGKIREVFEKGNAYMEANMLTKDNKKIPHYYNGWFVMYENQPCVIGIGIDITEKKQHQEQIAKEKNLSDSFINNLPGIVYVFTAEGKFLRWNNNLETISEYSAEEISRMHPLQFFDDKGEQQMIAERIYEVFSTGKSYAEAHFISKSGKKIPYYFNAWLITYENQPCVIGIGLDITERINAQEKLVQLHKELKGLYARQQNIKEEERKHIAREIHDELGQIMTGLKMDVSWVKKRLPAELPELQVKVDEIIRILGESVKTVRRISSELRPGIIDDIGLVAALQWQSKEFEKRNEITCNLTCNVNEIEMPPDAKISMFRIYQEALTNIMRHASATEVNTSVTYTNEALTLLIKDNGKGFDTSLKTGTLGLLGMKERAEMLNGSFAIESKIYNGTQVKVTVPVNQTSSVDNETSDIIKNPA